VIEPLVGYGLPSSRPGSAYFVTWRLDGSLPVTRVTDDWTIDGPKFVELDQLLDAVSTAPRWLERRDVADVVADALWKGVGESRYEVRSGALRAAAHTQQIGY
jgi:hypothetical protein